LHGGIDNPETFDKPLNPQSFTVTWRPELLGGVNVIQNEDFTLIPYYVWSNRGTGKMKVFLNNQNDITN
jgi:DUF1680 family protein